MRAESFVRELEASNQTWLAQLGELSALAGTPTQPVGGMKALLRIALANEISVAELAAMWTPTVTDWDIKIALAQQAGDEARHFQLIQGRLERLGIALDDFTPPRENPLFAYLKSLATPVEKIAAGQFTLESIAYQVNNSFLRYCELVGDKETAEIYRRYIQPDELHHHQLGRRLLEKYATTPEIQLRAREAATKTLHIAAESRAAATAKIGTGCFPGC
ncbi:MAG: ferritin-like domain-containing protein [Terriglobia bacterium]